MKIYFLGTGTSQGIPVIGSNHEVCLSKNPKDKRLRTSVWLQTNNINIIIDCGPDFRQQMLNSNCQFINAILFTHEHADHTAGLDDIRPFYFKQGNLNIYAYKKVLKNLEKRFDYIFEQDNKYPGAPGITENEIIENTDFYIKETKIVPIKAWHGNLQVFGFRINNFAYLTDVKTIDDSEILKLQNLDILVINALKIEPHNTHFNIEEALECIEKVNPKKAYITHISHLLGFHDEVEKSLPKNVYLAYDNLILNL